MKIRDSGSLSIYRRRTVQHKKVDSNAETIKKSSFGSPGHSLTGLLLCGWLKDRRTLESRKKLKWLRFGFRF